MEVTAVSIYQDVKGTSQRARRRCVECGELPGYYCAECLSLACESW